MLVFYVAILSILWQYGIDIYILWLFSIFYGYFVYVFYGYLVYFSRFGMLYQEKSGNPDVDTRVGVCVCMCVCVCQFLRTYESKCELNYIC
jgi:hypothetical protein